MEDRVAAEYASTLLAEIGAGQASIPGARPEHPAISWAQSGAMALTGRRDGPPRMCPFSVAACADGALLALASLAGRTLPGDLKGSKLLGERAALAGFTRNGAISPGGSCRFLETADGWIALNLARPDDWHMLSALVGADVEPDWAPLAARIRHESADDLVAQGRELGLAIAPLATPSNGLSPRWYEVIREAPWKLSVSGLPIIVDLSSLWAGPLCTHLLQTLGARVIKVESRQRPDGARQGAAAFYDLLNAGKESVAIDFATAAGREALSGLLASADIVVEASRPRALRQLGIDAEAIVAGKPGLTWVSITGYGRSEPMENWIAFGDDAGVAAGISAFLREEDGAPHFVGDAIADPLTGMHAALIAWQRWRSGAGGLVSIALHDVTARCIAFDNPGSIDAARDREQRWGRVLAERGVSVSPPSARTPRGRARELGADNDTIFAEFG